MATLPWSDALEKDLVAKQSAGRYRSHRVRDGAQGVMIDIEGKGLLSFCSNDYLGLANHDTVKQTFIAAAEQEGVGSGAAHLLTGHSKTHHELEAALADFLGYQRVLLFSSGYMANIGVLDGLLGKNDTLLQDKLNHASLLDGGRLSAATQRRYPHLDMPALERRLQQEATGHTLIATDGVFSMDGDLAPLADIMTLAKAQCAGVLVDDAHGFGVLGRSGQGSVAHWHLSGDEKPIMMGTFGKALGTAGAFVAADETTIETVIQHARSYVYTTAQPAAISAATLASLKLVQTESWRREKLQALISQFQTGAKELGLAIMPSITPIQPIVIGDDKRAIQIGQALEEKGILVGVIRPPTVAEGSARLRITLSANHSESHIIQLLDALEVVICH